MASRGGESGINLISSTYSDDDDEMEDVEHQEPPNENVSDNDDTINTEVDVVDSANDETPPALDDDSIRKSPHKSRPLTPQQFPQDALPSLPPLQPQQPVLSESSGSRMQRLTIVDYGHDEVAMSPEAEEGEIVDTGVVMIRAEVRTVSGYIQEQMPPGTAMVLTPSTQATTNLLFEQVDTSEPYSMINAVNESDSNGIEEAETLSVAMSKDVDPLDSFLPPQAKAKCSDALQEKINKFLNLKQGGKSYNAEVRKKKEYRNPDFLLHAVTYQDVDQIGSCFSKDVFNPRGYDKCDYYDEIEADMKREMDRKEQEKKKNQKVEFLSGGTQPGVVAPSPKISIPIPVPSVVDSVARDGRQNKKSKWDKVDGDRKNLMPSGGQDSVSSAGAHAALLTAANAGTGYTAFAQQRRREAEEKKSIEKKLERRS